VGLERRGKRNEEFGLPERLSEKYDGPASREKSRDVSTPGTFSSGSSCDIVSDKR
jgi:hypothetical protein